MALLGKKDKDIKNNYNAETLKATAKRVSEVPINAKHYRPSVFYTRNLLDKLINEPSKYKAMDILVDETPYGKMALNIYTTLTNPTGTYKFYNPKTGKQTKKPEMAFKQFKNKRWLNNDSGLDGLYEQLIRSLYTRGDMAFEIVIEPDLSGIKAILPIDPATFNYEWDNNELRWKIYQNRTDNLKIDLYDGNFFRYPYKPSINNPEGTLLFLPAIQATIDYYQHKTDSTVILNRVGYPRWYMGIDDKAVLEQAHMSEKQTLQDRNELFKNVFEDAAERLKSIDRDSDIISFLSNQIKVISGGNNPGIDLRTWFEVDAVDLANAYSLQKIFLNLESGGSYALGMAEQETTFKRIENSRDDVVDIKSLIGTMFCRINGFNAVCEFQPDPLEWEKLEEKWKAKNVELEFYRRLQEYGILGIDEVANIMVGKDKAYNSNKESFYEYVVRYIDETNGKVDNGGQT